MGSHKLIPRGEESAHPPGYIQNTDPGAVGAFKPWWVTDNDTTPTTITDVRIRNAADSAWISLVTGIIVSAPVDSVFGRTGAVIAVAGDYDISELGSVVIAGAGSGEFLRHNGINWINDVIQAGDIPSLDASIIASGVFNIARLATGTPDGTKFVRDDGTLAVPTGTGAPTDADYLVKTAHGTLSAERVVTDGTQITWDWAVAGQVKAQIVADVALGGNPTTTTQATSDDSTRIATTAFVQAVITALKNGVSAAYDTLAEIETALGLKAPLASPALTGTPTAPTAAAGTNNTQIATTAYADNAVAKQPELFMFALSDETTAITTGAAKVTWRVPFACTLVGVRAHLNTASSSGVPTVDVNLGGTSVFGATKLEIDENEKTSVTATNTPTISTSSLTDDGEITFDVDVAGTGAKGLKVYLYVTRT